MFFRSLVVFILVCSTLPGSELSAQNGEIKDVFARDNLMAWCIVPFDSEKRTPEQRAEMLKELGIRKLAYDYRAEHVPSFDEEIEQLQKNGIELSAWWFPGVLNDEARLILEKLEQHNVQTQLWVTGGGAEIDAGNVEEQRRRVLQEADRIRPIAEAAAKIGCSVGLYNHGGWFGDPANQLEIIDELGLPNVGIVYNLHHGHDHLVRFAELLQSIKPHLMALNLNGMDPGGDQSGKKILPLGAGSLDLEWMRAIRDCGYQGPIGILNHTDEDARARLLDNLDGLEWLKKQLDGTPAGPKPKYRSWKPTPPASNNSGQPALGGGRLFDSDLELRSLPLTVVCQAKLTQKAQYNILVANDTKASGEHWELFTQAGSGQFSVYLPGYRPDHVRSSVNICDSAQHQLAMIFEPTRVRLFVDARLVADQAVERSQMKAVPGALAIGRLVEGSFRCFGEIASVEIYRGVVDVSAIVRKQEERESPLIKAWRFTPVATDGSGTASPADSAPLASATNSGNATYAPELVNLLAEKVEQGNASRGAALFASATSACLSCHRIGDFGGTVGPRLSAIGTQRPLQHLIESVLWPNRLVEPKFQVTQILTVDGEQLRGYVVQEDDQRLTLQDPSSGRREVLPAEDIELRKLGPSLMPEGLVNAWTQGQQLDLIAFLADLGRGERLRPELAASVLEHSQAHAPTPFPFERAPIDPSTSPQWEAFVNRDRIYDFYTKQAAYFRTEDREAQLLMEFPGLDGGPSSDASIGHWGNQNEQTWASNDWNEAELGRVQSGVFRGDGGLTVARGVCLQLGDEHELNVCFDPTTMSYPAMWTGDFLEFSSVRHGFIHGLRPKGPTVPGEVVAGPLIPLLTSSENANEQNNAVEVDYVGFYRVGERVVFSLRVGEVEYLDAPWVIDRKFTREVGPRATHSFRDHLLDIPDEEPVSIETSVSLGTQTPYAIDTIKLPVENPWNMPLYCSGLDFLPDGSALIATMQGDVWHVEGFGAEDGVPTKPVWRRFASGLHQPLGLKVDEDGVFVLCRDQLLRLHDLNQDGVADFHECFSNAFETSAAGHDYICGLQRDEQGNFYTASGNQGLVRITADGRQAEVIAAGFRNADGLGITPSGVITVPCSEGEWTPASMICAVRTRLDSKGPDSEEPDSEESDSVESDSVESDSVEIGHGRQSEVPFYGYRGARYASLPIERPRLPLVYLPRGLDNSAGGQVYIDSDRWGPLEGKLVHLSFGTGKHFLLLQDEVDGQLQGAVVPLPGDFLSGVHRGRFSPKDRQLYLCGMAGWGSYTPEVGCFQRVRWTGEPVQLPVGFHVHENGVAIEFAEPLTSNVCRQAEQHFAQAWNYRYSAAYGSAEYSTRHYGYRGHDRLQIASAHVVDDGRTLFVEIPDLQVCNQLHLQLMIEPHRTVDLFATCNRLDRARGDIPGVQVQAKELAAHPLELDMLVATKKVDNPWRLPIDGARKLRIQADKNLTYDRQVLVAKPGEALALTFGNPDVVPHNWALVLPGALRSVGEQANRMVADPEALVRQYVPQSNEVLCYTDIVEPNQEFTIYFRAPEKPGRYPYLCTFPGHWMVMNGELIVQE